MNKVIILKKILKNISFYEKKLQRERWPSLIIEIAVFMAPGGQL